MTSRRSLAKLRRAFAEFDRHEEERKQRTIEFGKRMNTKIDELSTPAREE